MDGKVRKLFILDTNVLLHEPLSIYSFDEHDVLIPMTVLEELDRIKDRQKDVSRDARVAIRSLEDVFSDAEPEEIASGVPLLKDQTGETELGNISIFADHQLPLKEEQFTDNGPDNRIINAAIFLQNQNVKRKVVLVTKDINMRLKAKGAGLRYVEDYRSDQLIDDINLLAKGYKDFEGDFWSRIGDCQSESEGRHTIHTVDSKALEDTYINTYLIDESERFAGRVMAKQEDKTSFIDLGRERLMARHAWGSIPRISIREWHWMPCSIPRLSW